MVPISYNAPHPTHGRFAQARAKVAELVDALDLGSSGETRESSSLSFRTSFRCTNDGFVVGRGLALLRGFGD